MGDNDGFSSAISARGTNKLVRFNGGYFSFAFGDEIALKLEDRDSYYILNCGQDIFDEVRDGINRDTPAEQAISFWLDKSKTHKHNVWSASFDEL